MVEKCLVAKIQRWAINDGPGIRTLVLLMGCNMKCFWCHNPETISGKNTIYWKKMLCVQCGLCVESCPKKAIYPPIPVEEAREDGSVYHKIDRTLCDNCMKCVDACMHNALESVGKLMTADEVLDEVIRDEPFYKTSGGGMTVGGGEPTVHPEFLVELLRKGKEKGLHICLDTNGIASWKVYEATLPFVNIYLVDIKNMDSKIHAEGTGVGNERVLENIEKLSTAGASIHIRVPVIYDFNDFDENFEKMGKFLASLPNPVECVDLLPFHNWCQDKYSWLGIDWPLADEEAMDPIEVEDFHKILKSYGINCTIGG
jgi:glycerol dehydratase, cobalamin-independent, small subunit (EC 4.2.1.30)